MSIELRRLATESADREATMAFRVDTVGSGKYPRCTHLAPGARGQVPLECVVAAARELWATVDLPSTPA